MYNKLMQIQTELKAPKSQYNSFGKYHYRNVEDILEALKPLLLKFNCSIFISDTIELIGERYYIKATVTFVDNETGNSKEVTGYAREEQDKKGMDQMQLTGATSSYARKYALNGMFAIDDTKDSDTTNTHGNDNPQNTPQQTKSNQAVNTPPNQKKLTIEQLHALYELAEKKGRNSEEVKAACTSKFKLKSIEDMTQSQYDAVIKIYNDMVKND